MNIFLININTFIKFDEVGAVENQYESSTFVQR